MAASCEALQKKGGDVQKVAASTQLERFAFQGLSEDQRKAALFAKHAYEQERIKIAARKEAQRRSGQHDRRSGPDGNSGRGRFFFAGR